MSIDLILAAEMEITSSAKRIDPPIKRCRAVRMVKRMGVIEANNIASAKAGQEMLKSQAVPGRSMSIDSFIPLSDPSQTGETAAAHYRTIVAQMLRVEVSKVGLQGMRRWINTK